jgi:hypothetical protein
MADKCKLGTGISNKVGLKHDRAQALREISLGIIEESLDAGIDMTLEEVVEAVKKEVPGAKLKDTDIWNALGDLIEKPKGEEAKEDTIRRKIIALEIESRLMAKIDNAMRKVTDLKKKGVPVTNDAIEKLRADLKEFDRVARENAKDAAEKSAIFNAINEARALLSQDIIHVDESSESEQQIPRKFDALKKTLEDLESQIGERVEIQKLESDWKKTDDELINRGVTPENETDKAKSPELSALIDKRKRLQEELRIRRSLITRIKKLKGEATIESVRDSAKTQKTVVESREVETLRKEIAELKKNNAEDKKLAGLEKTKEALEKELVTGEKAAKEGKDKPEESTNVQIARQQIKELKKEIADKKAADKKEVSKQKAIEKERKALEERRDKAKKRLVEGREAVSPGRRTLRRPKRTAENQKIQDEIDSLTKQIREKEALERKEQKRFEDLNDRLARAEERLKTGIKAEILKTPPSAEISPRNDATKQKLAEVNEAIKIRNAENAKAERKRKSIERYEGLADDAEKGIQSPPSPKRTTDPDIDGARKAYLKAKKRLNTKKSIAELKQMMASMKEDPNYSPPINEPQKREQEQDDDLFLLLKEEQDLKRELSNLQAQNNWNESGVLGKVGIGVAETALAMRSIMLSGEVGFLFRQTAANALNIPQTILTKGLLYKTFIQSMHKGWTEKGALQMSNDMRNDPRFIEAQRAGLPFRDYNHQFSASEEFTQSWLINKVPYLRGFIQLNDRLMTTYMNAVTHEFFYSYMDRYDKKANLSTDTKKEIAAGISRTTGRGDAWGIQTFPRWANLVMLAPRYLVSRITAPWMQGYKAVVGSSAEKAIFAETYGGFIMTGLGVLAMASQIPGVTVGTDPDDSDFMKILWGNKRIDIWGGFLQPARFIMQMVYKTLQTAELMEVPRKKRTPFNKGSKEQVAYFLGNRTSPIVNFGTAVMDGELFMGEEYNLAKWVTFSDPSPETTAYKTMKEFSMTLLYGETVEAYGLEGAESAVVSFILNEMGFGTNTYKKGSKSRKSNDPVQNWIDDIR